MARRAAGRRALRSVTLCVTVLAGVLVPSEADAYVLGRIGPWPGHTIRYYNATSYTWPVEQAVIAWNRSTTARPLRRHLAQARRTVIVKPWFRSVEPENCRGHAVGRDTCQAHCAARAGFSSSATVLRFHIAGVLAHELETRLSASSHENRRCAAMRCPRLVDDAARDGVPPPAPVCAASSCSSTTRRGAARLYGGKAKAPRPQFCWKYPPPTPPTGVASETRRTRRRPTSSCAGKTSARRPSIGCRYRRGLGTCPATPGRGPGHLGVEVAARCSSRSTSSFDVPSASEGRQCLVLRSLDAADRSGGSTSIEFDYVDAIQAANPVRGHGSDPARRQPVRLSWRNERRPHPELTCVGHHQQAGGSVRPTARARASARSHASYGAASALTTILRRWPRAMVLRRSGATARTSTAGVPTTRRRGRPPVSAGTAARARRARGRARGARGRRPARGSRTRPCRRPSRPRGGSPSRAGRARRRGR